ncbi:MAG: glycosyltransferase family 2 protein [Eubacteriales bacterium]
MISIIIAVYNEEKYISETVRSILNQSYRDIELIIVNDGSTDDTMKLLNEFCQYDMRVRVFNPGKLGKNGAYNYAANEVKGEWFVMFSGDDILEPGILQEWFNASLDYNPYKDKVVFASRLRMFTTDKKYKIYDGIQIPKNPNKVCKSGAAFMASKTILNEVFPIPTQFPNEDNWISLYFEFFNVIFIPILKICMNYRIHSNNSLNKNAEFHDFNNKYNQRLIIIKSFYDKYYNQLNKLQCQILLNRYNLEMLRYNGKILKILCFKNISIIEKIRNVFLCNSFLYTIKINLNRFILGR